MGDQGAGWPVTGHHVAVDLLSRAVRSGDVAHAYLITGPAGVGRSTLALTFASALSCAAPAEQRPCGQCSACRRIARGIYPDVSVTTLASQAARSTESDRKNTRISIDVVRELRSSISLRPMEGDWRVAVIEDADLLSRDASDSILKTLEEPPPFVVIVLIATEFEALPATIRSRCLHIPLGLLSRAEITAVLIGRGVDAGQAAMIASISRGRIGQSLELAADAEALAARRDAVEACLKMIDDPLIALGCARRLAEAFRRGQREQVQQQLDLLVGLWRDMLLVRIGCADQVVNTDVTDRITALAGRWGPGEIHTGLKATYQALIDLCANVLPRLALDYMVVQWPANR